MPPSLTMSYAGCHLHFFPKVIPVQLHGAGGVLPPATAAVSSLLATQGIAKLTR